jgi:hypothetical protein
MAVAAPAVGLTLHALSRLARPVETPSHACPRLLVVAVPIAVVRMRESGTPVVVVFRTVTRRRKMRFADAGRRCAYAADAPDGVYAAAAAVRAVAEKSAMLSPYLACLNEATETPAFVPPLITHDGLVAAAALVLTLNANCEWRSNFVRQLLNGVCVSPASFVHGLPV